MDDLGSDGDVIRASLEDPELFEVIFERHHARVFAYLARRVGPDNAGDLASDVFLTAFQQRSRFRSDSAEAGPWLYGIASNLAKRQMRTWRRGSRATLRAVGEGALWLDPTAEDRIDAEALRGTLIRAMATMRSQEREVLLLFALSDLSYAEISEALNIPVGTVRSRLARGRDRVRRFLEQAGYAEHAADLMDEGGRNAS